MQVGQPAFLKYNPCMTVEYGEYTLKQVEIKIHDTRRKIEGLLELLKMDIPLPEEEIESLIDDLQEAHRLMLNYYFIHKNGPVMEEIVLETPSNVVEFPSKQK